MKLSTKTLISLLGFGLLATSVGVGSGGCSGDSGATGKSSGSSSSSTSSGTGGSDLGLDGGVGSDAELTPDNACRETSVQATYRTRPVDIIFVIDNSRSMTEEIVTIQNNINENFASIIKASGVDYRVIMLSNHGDAQTDQSICIKSPLSGTTCEPIPPQPVDTNVFYQYAVEIGSHNSLCTILDTVNGGVKDRFNFAPMGWSQWLRPDALKVFVEVTDDNTDCTTATLTQNVAMNDNMETVPEGTTVANTFDKALTTIAPTHFGTPTQRNYVFFSFVGMAANMPATDPWPPTAPVNVKQCPLGVGPGTGYQTLSVLTNGFRYPVCNTESYDKVFQGIANTVISGSKLDCEFSVPQAPNGEQIDINTVLVEYTPGSGGTKQTFTKVNSVDECKPQSFYVQDKTIKLCPDACSVVHADNSAHLSILYGCTGMTN